MMRRRKTTPFTQYVQHKNFYPANTKSFLKVLLWLVCLIQISQSLQLQRPGEDPNVGLFAAPRTISSTSTTNRSPLASPRLPPWEFKASRIYYQFRAIPEKQARKCCPPACSSSSSQPWQALMDSPLILLSVAGFTLGGVFCIEYKDSPIGAYREVAILSSLVGRPSFFLPSIGAWASHIFVDSEDAANYGAQYWGLPAKVMAIDFKSENDKASLTTESTGNNVMFSNQEIEVSGWSCEETTAALSKAKSWLSPEWVDLSLPSFSGCLPVSEGGGISSMASTPLLQYPLRIHHPQSITLVENGVIRFADCIDRGAISEVKELLTNSHPLLSVDVGPVELEAGRTTLLG